MDTLIVWSLILGGFFLLGYMSYWNWKIDVYEKQEKSDLAKANKTIGELDSRVLDYAKRLNELTEKYNNLGEDFHKLRGQKISADVKMGQKSENLLPFLSTFPYAEDEIRGLFNPIDLIVFRDDEVVFVEVKSGQAQLSSKQKRIKENIQAGRVRFETHRMDEKGVKIK